MSLNYGSVAKPVNKHSASWLYQVLVSCKEICNFQPFVLSGLIILRTISSEIHPLECQLIFSTFDLKSKGCFGLTRIEPAWPHITVGRVGHFEHLQ